MNEGMSKEDILQYKACDEGFESILNASKELERACYYLDDIPFVPESRWEKLKNETLKMKEDLNTIIAIFSSSRSHKE